MSKTKATKAIESKDGQVIVTGEMRDDGVTYHTSLNGVEKNFSVSYTKGHNMPEDFYFGMSDEVQAAFSQAFVDVNIKLGFVPEDQRDNAVAFLTSPKATIYSVEEWLEDQKETK